jgi:long-chain acyl-CoA synthetase
MKSQLDHVYDHESRLASRPWLTQPMGGGVIREVTWAEGMREVRRMAAHLRALGLPPGSRIAIFAKNNAWWLMSDLAIWMAGHVSVPVYPTLAAGTIRQILLHAEVRLLLVGKLDNFAAMAAGIPDGLPRIALPLAPALDAPSWDEIVRSTAPMEESPRRDPDDLATIIYTSGSTGEPKGVMHSFRTMCAAFAFADVTGLTSSDRVISYLPLAHVAERAVLETTHFLTGCQVYFVESLDTFLADVRRARPTVFGSVPRLWLKLRAGVLAKIPERTLARLLRIPVFGGIVRRKVLEGLGLGAVRFAATGSAPTPPELIDWYASLGIHLSDIYGMTENAAVSHCVHPGRGRPGWAGSPLPGVVCRISEAGEILVKSPGTMVGYFKADQLTREAIDDDGFLRTGDRGEADAEGRIRLSGRVKELFKTSKGKYVAPSPIETRLLAHAELEQACVTGPNMAQPLALVVLAEHLRKASPGGPEREALTRRLQDRLAALNAELDPHEQLEKIVVMSEEWTVDNGLLTPTMKLKRSAIEARYAGLVSSWYSGAGRIVWA